MRTYRRPSWRRDESGATAVEFAFLAVPFFIFIIAIIEVALVLAHASILEGAAFTAARQIRVGQVQQAAGDPEDVFRDALCGHARIMDCGAMQYSVTTLENFGEAAEQAATFDDEGNLEDPQFDAGGSGSIVIVRVSYLYRMLTPLVGQFFANYPDNRRLLFSTVILQTEPYEFD